MIRPIEDAGHWLQPTEANAVLPEFLHWPNTGSTSLNGDCVDAEQNERFTDLLRSRISNYRIVHAGVSGYGTDQEYLLLQRMWAKIQPSVVVLIFCTDNDRLDNGTKIRYDGYQKRYFATNADGALALRGQPAPPRASSTSSRTGWCAICGSPAWPHLLMWKSDIRKFT
jgi:hypothetical protein